MTEAATAAAAVAASSGAGRSVRRSAAGGGLVVRVEESDHPLVDVDLRFLLVVALSSSSRRSRYDAPSSSAPSTPPPPSAPPTSTPPPSSPAPTRGGSRRGRPPCSERRRRRRATPGSVWCGLRQLVRVGSRVGGDGARGGRGGAPPRDGHVQPGVGGAGHLPALLQVSSRSCAPFMVSKSPDWTPSSPTRAPPNTMRTASASPRTTTASPRTPTGSPAACARVRSPERCRRSTSAADRGGRRRARYLRKHPDASRKRRGAATSPRDPLVARAADAPAVRKVLPRPRHLPAASRSADRIGAAAVTRKQAKREHGEDKGAKYGIEWQRDDARRTAACAPSHSPPSAATTAACGQLVCDYCSRARRVVKPEPPQACARTASSARRRRRSRSRREMRMRTRWRRRRPLSPPTALTGGSKERPEMMSAKI